MRNPEVERKEEEENRLLVKDEDLEEIFEAFSAKDILEQMLEFYGTEEIARSIPGKLVDDIILQKRHAMSVSQLETTVYYAQSGIYGKFKLEDVD